MRRIQQLVVLVSHPLAGALVIASGVLASGLVTSGCGGSTEAAKSGEATQVAWKQAEDEKSEAPTADREPQSTGTEIDLDALEAQPEKGSAKAAPAAAKAKAEPKPEAKVEAPPPADEPPAAPEVEEPVEEPPAPPATVAAVPLGKEMRAAVKGTEPEPPAKKAPAKKKPAAAAAAAPAYTGPNPCTTAHFNVPRVEEACANGGRSAAKSVMKDAIGKALASGASLKCATCHADQTNFTLKKDAVAELKKWLGP